jgi:hypothetical protein
MQEQTNKWLTMGVTPSALVAAMLEKEKAAKDRFKAAWANSNSKRDHVAFCEWADEVFPDGFTFADLIDKKGRTVIYWRQFIFELRQKHIHAITLLGSKRTGTKQGRTSIYKINPKFINALRQKES